MRYSHEQLLKLRSGQGVWRVLIHVGYDGNLQGTVQRNAVVGKKINHWFKHHETRKPQWMAVRMECRRVEQQWRHAADFHPNYGVTASFLGDLMGDGAFSKRTQAERYLAEVLEGLHPAVEKNIRRQDEMDRDLESMWDEYDDMDLIPDEDDGHWRHDDPVWNKSEGQGA